MAQPEPYLQIGALSKRTGCNIETIRYYERIGLLPSPARSVGGYRQYSLGHLKRLHFIRRAREIGFSLDEVRLLLRLADDRVRSCDRARSMASEHLTEIKSKIAHLRRIQVVLREMVARCDEGAVPECPVIDALFDEADHRPSNARSAKRALPT